MTLARRAGSPLRCPECGRTCPGYDVRRREWRGLDAWGHKTFVVYDVPRVECPEHGVTTTRVPWAEGAVEVHGGVRVAGDRLVARGERACGVAAAALELDGGRWDHGACGAPGFGASRDAGAAAAERGRDVVQAGPQVRDGGVGLGDEGRAARGAGP